MRNALKKLGSKHTDFIYKECRISREELVDMDEDSLYSNVYDVMCDIEIAEIPTDDNEEENEKCILASDIVTILGNALAKKWVTMMKSKANRCILCKSLLRNDVKEAITGAGIKYPGNKKNPDSECYQHKGTRIIVSPEGKIVSVVRLEDST